MDRATHEKSQPSRCISSSPHRDSARAVSKTETGDSLLSVFQRLTGCPTGTIQRTWRKWLEHDVTAHSGFRRRETHDVHDCLIPEAPLLQGFHSPSSLLHSCCRRGPSGRRERLETACSTSFPLCHWRADPGLGRRCCVLQNVFWHRLAEAWCGPAM